MVRASQKLNSSRDLSTPLSGMICHPWDCYDQPATKSLYLHPLWRYERRRQNIENGAVWSSYGSL